MEPLLSFRPKATHKFVAVFLATIIFLIALLILSRYVSFETNTVLFLIFVYGSVEFLYIVYVQLRAANMLYEVTEREVIETKGILFKHKRIIPIINLDNIVINREDFIDLLFGFGTVYIDSPGGPGYEITVRRVDLNTINKLNEILSERIENLQKTKPEGKISK